MYVFDMGSDGKNIGFQELFEQGSWSIAKRSLMRCNKNLYDVVNRIFTSAYDKCGVNDKKKLYIARTTQVYADFVSLFDTTMLEFLPRDDPVEVLQPAAKHLIAILEANSLKMSAEGIRILEFETYLGFIKLKSIVETGGHLGPIPGMNGYSCLQPLERSRK